MRITFFIMIVFSLLMSCSLSAAPHKKVMMLYHTAWQDKLIFKTPKRVCRTSRQDCAKVLEETVDMLVLKWDDYGVEAFERQGDIWRLISSERLEQLFVYDLETPLIRVNPYGQNPLTAEIKFGTDRPARIVLRIKGIPPAEDVVAYFNTFSTQHTYPILGLYPKHKNMIELTAFYQDGTSRQATAEIETGAVNREDFYTVLEKQDKDSHYYWSFDGVIYDEYGYMRFATDGTERAYWFEDEVIVETKKGLERRSVLGKKLQEYIFPADFSTYRYGHGVGRMPNKNILIMGSVEGAEVLNGQKIQASNYDFLLELDYRTGKEVKRWDLAAVLNPDRHTIVKADTKDFGKNDWIHTNSVMYDPTKKALILSGRHVGMFSIDYETGGLNWMTGPRLGYEKSGRLGKGPAIMNKVLMAVDKTGKPLPEDFQKGYQISDAFKWPTTTHDAKVLGKGYFSIFDNNDKAYDLKVKSDLNSRPVIYRIDPDKKTIYQVWSHYLGLYSQVGSSVFWQPGSPNVFASLSAVGDKNLPSLTGHVYRFDFKTKQKRFEGIVKYHGKNKHYWHYKIEPIAFYPPENRNPPKE